MNWRECYALHRDTPEAAACWSCMILLKGRLLE